MVQVERCDPPAPYHEDLQEEVIKRAQSQEVLLLTESGRQLDQPSR